MTVKHAFILANLFTVLVMHFGAPNLFIYKQVYIKNTRIKKKKSQLMFILGDVYLTVLIVIFF